MKRTLIAGIFVLMTALVGSSANADTITFTGGNSGEVYGSWGFGNGWFYGVINVELNGQPTIAILTSEMQEWELLSDRSTYMVAPVSDFSQGYVLNNGVNATRDMFALASQALEGSVQYFVSGSWGNFDAFKAAARQEMVMNVLASPYDFHAGNLYYTTQSGQLGEYDALISTDPSTIAFGGTMVLVPGSQVGSGLQYSDLLVLDPDLYAFLSGSQGTGDGGTTNTGDGGTTKPRKGKGKRRKK